eukprot:15466748-Alexandrium_andersonii.AAC.1
MQAVIDDVSLQPPMPVLILGDVNADLTDISPVMSALQRGVLHDLAANSALTNASTPLTTCCAHGSATMTRRDYAIANSLALCLVSSVAVVSNAGFDVHLPLDIEIAHHTLED